MHTSSVTCTSSPQLVDVRTRTSNPKLVVVRTVRLGGEVSNSATLLLDPGGSFLEHLWLLVTKKNKSRQFFYSPQDVPITRNTLTIL